MIRPRSYHSKFAPTGGFSFIMSKLTLEDKKEIIRLRNEEGYGTTQLSKIFKIGRSKITLLIRRYDFHGEKIFDKTYNVISSETKLEIIQKFNDGCSITKLMIEYLVSNVQIHKWVSQYEKLGYDGLENKKKGRPPSMKKEVKPIDPNDKDALIKQLEERNKELECEVEALKKLRALVQQRSKQQTKKKQ